MDNLLQTFGKDVFTWRPLHAGDMHNLDVQAFTICLLNFIYVYNVRRGVSAASEDPIVAHFLTDICELLEAAAWLRDKPAEDFIPQQDTSTRIASQLQLELVKDAWRRATDSTYAGST